MPGEEIDKDYERALEYRVYNKWEYRQAAIPCANGLWKAIVARQVPLFDRQKRDGWGHVDLLGIKDDGRPVVIEIKKATNCEVPFRAVLEAVSYAIAVRKVWQVLGAEIACQFKNAFPEVPDLRDGDVTSVVLAPDVYWQLWKFHPAVKTEAKKALYDLVQAFTDKGYPVRLAVLTGAEDDNKMAVKEAERPF